MLGCRGSCRVTVPLQCFVRGLFTLFLPQKSVHRAKRSVLADVQKRRWSWKMMDRGAMPGGVPEVLH